MHPDHRDGHSWEEPKSWQVHLYPSEMVPEAERGWAVPGERQSWASTSSGQPGSLACYGLLLYSRAWGKEKQSFCQESLGSGQPDRLAEEGGRPSCMLYKWLTHQTPRQLFGSDELQRPREGDLPEVTE